MIEPTLDKTEGINLKIFCFETAKQLGIENEIAINNAIKKGWEMYNNFSDMTKQGIPHNKAIQFAIENKIEKM